MLTSRKRRVAKYASRPSLFGISISLAVAEQRTSKLSQRIAPLLRPATITTLEWRLEHTQLMEVQERIDKLTDASGLDPYCCASYWYDPTKNKVMARLVYSSDAIDHITVVDAKQKLSKAAQSAAATASAEVKIEDGINLDDRDFEVEFVAPGYPDFKIFAVYRDGQMEMIDRPLK